MMMALKDQAGHKPAQIGDLTTYDGSKGPSKLQTCTGKWSDYI